MKKYSKITIDKAVGLTGKCLCCNSIMEIISSLNDYNKKNVTNYFIQTQYKLYTTKGCTNCNLSKSLINSQKLEIEIVEAQEKEVEYLGKNNIATFPVLEIKSGEKVEFISGKDVGEYLASNLERFK